MTKLLRYALPLVALGLVACVPVGTPTVQCRDDFALEQEVLNATNADRAKHGLAPVAWNDELAAWAEAHSRDMADAGFIYHIDWTQIDAGDWEGTNIVFPGPELRPYKPVDNVQGPAIPPRDGAALELNWYNSPPHRTHILWPEYTHAGIGVVCRDGAQWATQIFGQT